MAMEMHRSLARGRATRIACVALAVLACVAGCARPAPEAALRDAVAGVQQAIEARDADALAALLADDFIGPDGLDRDGARRLAALHWLRHERVGLTVGPLDVQVRDVHGRADFPLVVSGGSGLIPERAGTYAVRTGWRLVDGEWRMTSAAWERQL